MRDERVAIVTGASRGIGRAIALGLGDDGYRVVVHYRDREAEAQDLAGRLQASGRPAVLVRADLGAPGAAETVVRACLDAFGRADVLVNNAGTHLPGVRLADVRREDWERILAVNLTAPFQLIQAVLPAMRAAGRGAIVSLSSNVTQRLPATYGPYTVSKAGLEALTRILAKEEGSHGIRVNAIAPGPIATDMLAESFAVMGPERVEAFVRSVPLGRTGRPEEIAAAVRWVVSDAASYVTGQVIYVNGGGPGG